MPKSSPKKPVVLCVLDGWGAHAASAGNAIHLAKTPTYDQLLVTAPHTFLEASGTAVGLPDQQMGNSEVGHLTLGSGRVLRQGLTKINHAIGAGELSKKQAFQALIKQLKATGGRCHLMGLLSAGGVHSHTDHILHLVEILAREGIPVALHMWLDGRDTPPKSALLILQKFLESLQKYPHTRIETLGGRYYAMDRDTKWERVKKAYQVMIDGKGPRFMDPIDFIGDCYKQEVTDEFLPPHSAENYQGIQAEDGLLIANFRADRVRQILTAILSPDFDSFLRPKGALQIPTVGMVDYADWLKSYMHSLFPHNIPSNTLAEVIAQAGKTQLHLAETEKYAHVTYFFNGGVEEPVEGETRMMVNSPDVATYDLSPKMAAAEVTEKLVKAVVGEAYDFVVVNFANADMVGHTGNLPATIEAVEALDKSLALLVTAVKKQGGILLITADHGNAEEMVNAETGAPHTAHTKHKVPFILVGESLSLKSYGTLADVAPTVLDLLQIQPPADMTGKTLII